MGTSVEVDGAAVGVEDVVSAVVDEVDCAGCAAVGWLD